MLGQLSNKTVNVRIT